MAPVATVTFEQSKPPPARATDRASNFAFRPARQRAVARDRDPQPVRGRTGASDGLQHAYVLRSSRIARTIGAEKTIGRAFMGTSMASENFELMVGKYLVRCAPNATPDGQFRAHATIYQAADGHDLVTTVTPDAPAFGSARSAAEAGLAAARAQIAAWEGRGDWTDDYKGFAIVTSSGWPPVTAGGYTVWRSEPNNSLRLVLQGHLDRPFETFDEAHAAAGIAARRAIDTHLVNEGANG